MRTRTLDSGTTVEIGVPAPDMHIDSIQHEGQMMGRQVRPVTHWSTSLLKWSAISVGGAAILALGISHGATQDAALFVAKWVTPVALGTSSVILGIGTCCLKRFVPQRALEEDVDVEMGLTEQLGSNSRRLKELQEQYDQLLKKNEMLQKEREASDHSFHETIEGLRTHVGKLSEERAHLNNTVSGLSTLNAQLQNSIAEMRTNLNKYTVENDVLHEIQVENERLLESAKASILAFGREIPNLSAENSSFRETLGAISSYLVALHRENQELKENIEKFQVNAALLKDSVTEEKELGKELSEHDAAFIKQIEGLKQSIEALQLENNELRSQVEHLHKIVDEAKQVAIDVGHSEEAFGKRAKEFQESTEQFASLVQEEVDDEQSGTRILTDIQKQMLEFALQEKHIAETSAASQKILMQLDEKEKVMLATIEKYKEQIVALEEQADLKQEILALLTQKIEEYSACKRNLEADIAELRELISQVKT